MTGYSSTLEEVLAEAGLLPKWVEEGLRKGREEGWRKSQEEYTRKRKARGRPVNEIAEDTGLTIEEIEKL